MLRQSLPPPLVVKGTLLASGDAADGQAVRLVEERNRFGVLTLVVLDRKAEPRIVRVDRKRLADSSGRGVATQEVESMLTGANESRDLVAER